MSDLKVGLEFFPPRPSKPNSVTQAKINFRNTVGEYTWTNPAVVSVTHHGSGGTREGVMGDTFATIDMIRDVFSAESNPNVSMAAHITAALSKNEVAVAKEMLRQRRISKILAITGEFAEGVTRTPKTHYRDSIELTEAFAKNGGRHFHISVAADPADMSAGAMLKLLYKIRAGAREIITQYSFDNDQYLRFRDAARREGITVPITFGLMPVRSLEAGVRLATEHHVDPAPLIARMNALKTPENFFRDQITRLKIEGAEKVYVYTLNRTEPALKVLDEVLALPPRPAKALYASPSAPPDPTQG